MEQSDKSIIATLAHYGAFQWPLTLMDIHERLIPPSRFGGVPGHLGVSALLKRLDTLTAAGTVVAHSGFYFLSPAADDVFTRRIEREKECAQKWRRMRRYARWLQAVPYVRALLASGSLALGNTGPDSDWDVFVIAQARRLYTARTFLLLAAKLMGRLRTKHEFTAPDKFCFNHYVTTDGLTIRHRSLYVAHGLANLVPVYDRGGWLGKLRQENSWTSEFAAGDGGTEFVRRAVKYSPMLNFIRRSVERLLDTGLGNWLEGRLRRWQQSRIRRVPATHEKGGRVVADEQELEFHPRSFEATALAHYNSILARHGLSDFCEEDSGLTR